MAKAKKKSGKRVNLNPSMPKKLKNENTTWDELMQLRKECSESLIQQQVLLKSLTDQFKETIDKNDEVKQILVGTFNSYNDIAEKVRKNMEFHMTINEKNEIVDYKKGKVDSSSEDYLDFLSVASNYIFAQEQIADLSARSFTELLTSLNTDGSISQNDIDSITTTQLKGKIELAKTMQETLGKQNGK